MNDVPHVETRDLSKRFGGVQALNEVSVSVERGTVHALVGENGAGKSTLGKLIAGVQQPTAATCSSTARSFNFARRGMRSCTASR